MSDSVHGDRSTTRQSANRTDPDESFWSFLGSPRFVRWVCALGVAVVLGDLVTTVYGLEIGLRERNPFVVTTMNQFGVWGLVGLKLVSVAWVALIWQLLGRRYGLAAMAGLILPQGTAVVLNVLTIATAF